MLVKKDHLTDWCRKKLGHDQLHFLAPDKNIFKINLPRIWRHEKSPNERSPTVPVNITLGLN